MNVEEDPQRAASLANAAARDGMIFWLESTAMDVSRPQGQAGSGVAVDEARRILMNVVTCDVASIQLGSGESIRCNRALGTLSSGASAAVYFGAPAVSGDRLVVCAAVTPAPM